jgi:subtilisin family serine protease
MLRAALTTAFVLTVAPAAFAVDTTGRVVDEKDQPVAGATLRIDPKFTWKPSLEWAYTPRLHYVPDKDDSTKRDGGGPAYTLSDQQWDLLKSYRLGTLQFGARYERTSDGASRIERPEAVRIDWSRVLDWLNEPGGTPLVGRSALDGGFRIGDSSQPWRRAFDHRCTLRGSFQNYRSMPVETQLGTAVGNLKYFDRDICLRWSGMCYQDLWRQAQPLPVAIQASDGSPVGEVQTQWALKKINLPAQVPDLQPVTVAVIDSGLDWTHPNLRPENIWKNPAPGASSEYKDDLLGWDFVEGTNAPWDDFGHGTFVAGLVLAVNPAARIMTLKVLDAFGGGPASSVSRAIEYAVNNGARVINLSLGGQGLALIEQHAVDYARERGAVVVVAAGNGGNDTASWGPAGVHGVLGVAATDQNDKRAGFGNWGQQVALAAPGVDVVSLRARWSDFVLVATGGEKYTAGTNIMGSGRWLFRASGTSFAAPLVAGAASLLLSVDPNLTNRQVERMLIESADDIEVPGWDQFSGAGRLNVGRALQANPNYHLTARVSRVNPVQERGQVVIQVLGTATGSRLQRYEIQVGQGADPARWKTVATERDRSVRDALLGTIPIKEITARGQWSIRLLVHDGAGRTKEARGTLNVQ